MAQTDDEWKFVCDYPITHCQCGVRARERVRLKRDIVMRNHRGKPTGKVYPAGEIWTVVEGSAEPPLDVWLRQADGEPHTWDDTDAFWEQFERVDDVAAP